jgi:hypothetical protein
MLPPRAWKDVISDWAPELGVKLNRDEDRIRTRGLGASDFSPSSWVEIRYPHGATHRFSFAFAVVRPTEHKAAVFSEHAGYLEFELTEETIVAEIHEEIYRHEA